MRDQRVLSGMANMPVSSSDGDHLFLLGDCTVGIIRISTPK